MEKKWNFVSHGADPTAAAKVWGVPPIIAQLLLNRGIDPNQSCTDFLSPRLATLHSPSLLQHATAAATLIVNAIRTSTPIVIYGDYDVDGTTGVSILWHLLTHAGATVRVYVPHRIDEGYGLNQAAVDRLVAEGAGLIISVDCGITAVEVATSLKDTDVTLVITDHHTPGDTLPEADAIVHPSLDDKYPSPDLCGAGVAFKLAWAIAQQLSDAERVSAGYRELLMAMLPLAALGTIADVVPLVNENRVIAKNGLEGLAYTKLPGLRALMSSAGLRSDRISTYDVGFKLAPRINAAGRMGHADLAVELFTCADNDRAQEIALYLEEQNRSRQATERRITKQAMEMIERDNLAGDARRAIVLASEGWHPGVIGIVAARVVDRYHRPTVIISTKDDEGQGSARGISAFHLAKALTDCHDHLMTHGGHAMAAGLRIKTDRIEAFTEAFVALANNRLTGDDLVPKLRLDAEVALDELTLPTAEAIDRLGPFGVGNPKPRFATGWVALAAEPRLVGAKQDHLQAAFEQDGVRIRAIGFGLGAMMDDLQQHRRCRIAFEPIINEFNGRRSVEMRALDIQFPS